MKKILYVISLAMISTVASSAVVYDGERYEHTKSTAPSKTVYVEPKNVSSVAARTSQQQIIDWATPKECVITAEMVESDTYDNPITIPAGQTVTIIPTTNLNPGTEICVSKPENNKLRNFEVYLPNEPEVRAGLPCGFDLSELPEGIRCVYVNGIQMVPTLPAKVSIRQPYSRLVIGEIVTFDDGWDWNPVITNCSAVWNGKSLVSSNGKRLFEGTNLQAGMSIKVAYPISGGTIVTNDVTKTTNIGKNGWLDGTYYEYVTGFDFTPPADQLPASSGGPVTFTYIYETKSGKVPATWAYTFDPFAE